MARAAVDCLVYDSVTTSVRPGTCGIGGSKYGYYLSSHRGSNMHGAGIISYVKPASLCERCQFAQSNVFHQDRRRLHQADNLVLQRCFSGSSEDQHSCAPFLDQQVT